MPLIDVFWAAAQAWGVWACGSSAAWPCSGASVLLPLLPDCGPGAGVEELAVFEGPEAPVPVPESEVPEPVPESEEPEVPDEGARRDPAGTGERLSMECSSNTPLRPTTPLTTPDNEAGTPSVEVLTTARA